MLSRFNDVKREIFSIGNSFKLYNTITFNFKGKDDRKLDPIYEQSYSSSKYSNIAELSSLNIRSSDFLVFSFKEKVEEEFLSNEVYVSYPHIAAMKEFLNNVATEIISNESKIYTPRGITKEAEEMIFESPECSSQKRIAIAPAKIDYSTRESNIMVNGVAIFIGEEQYCVWTDLNTFATMVTIVSDEFSLSKDSAMTLIMAQNYEILSYLQSNKGENSSRTSSMNNSSSFSRRPATTQRSIFSKGNTGNNVGRVVNRSKKEVNEDDEEERNEMKPLRKNTVSNQNASKEELDDIMNGNDNDIEENENVENTPKRTIKKTSKNDDPVISLDDVMNMVNDDDLDINDLNLDED